MPLVMASLRLASPRLRNYFKENYIPQVCEVLETSGAGVRRERNWKRFPRGGTGVWWREGVEVQRSEKERMKSDLGRSAVWAEHTDQRVDDGGVTVAERGEWVTSPREKEQRASGQKPQTPTFKFWTRGA